tara:strand:- start:55 stop:294 length:240 start_codon:yes stop_codon:yes gene_type:complete
MAVIKSKKANKYSIKTFILLFFTIFFIAEPKAAQGEIDNGQITKATQPINKIDVIRFPLLGRNPEAAIEDMVHALGLTI